MLHSLLVPLDGTRFSEFALPLAEGIARATGASVHLAHVHVPHPPDDLVSSTPFQYEGLDLDAYDDRLRQDERTYLDRLTFKVADRTPCVVEGTLLDGDVEAALERHARDVAADFVVLTTHARDGLGQWLHGSVAERLIRQSRLPVLAVPGSPDARPPEDALAVDHILVALDGSDPAEAIVAPARELAASSGARITLLHVLSSRFRSDPQPVYMPDDWERSMGAAEDYLEEVRDGLRMEGLSVDTVVYAHPSPSKAICEIAGEMEVGMVAMTTHGRTGLSSVLLGSVAHDVLARARRPVLIQRPGAPLL
jgi:nucleotide-binding universal stress UspA family protein